ncbi:MAG: glycoside hydrolase family 3 N-terminal domain-containing protein [Gemmatimonadota bacterium]|nr:glycoside hydrolase family 3 N-terminal domain-containing protein [Gemmatimonadota bacterium]
MRELGQHVIAAIGWDRDAGWTGARETIDRAIAAGVGGFLLRGGPRYEVAQLARALHAHTPVPPLVAADFERGAGDRFHGAVALPPALALASLGEADVVRRAARIVARDARELGINWALGPVCDLDLDNGNPIVGTRGFSGDAQRVAELAAEWIDACQAESVLACAKHFPGHGRTHQDSHLGLPVQEESLTELLASDLVPFRAAVDSGVASVMTAHVAFPALDHATRAATLSPPTIALLRGELGFEGLIVSDALDMSGVLSSHDQGEAAVRALMAGCDLLLAPTDPPAVVRALQEAAAAGRLDLEALEAARRRRDWWAAWGRWLPDSRGPTLDDRTWAKQAADRVLQLQRGRVPWVPPTCEVVMVDDDPASAAPSRWSFIQSLQSLGRTVNVVPGATAGGEGVLVIAVFADVLPGKGHVSLTAQSRLTVRLAVQAARTLKRDSLVVLFGHPRLAAELPDAAHLLCAWSGDRGMQEAAARALVS